MIYSRFARQHVFRMTEEETGGGSSGGLPAGGSPGAQDGGAGGLGSASGDQGGLTPPASNPWDSVPRSWAQEHHPLWEKTPAEVRQILHKRESDFEKGIGTYRDAAGRWQKLSSVFEPVTRTNPNVDVAGVYETLAQNHLAMLQAAPEDRRAMFQRMAEFYGVEFAQAAAGQQGAQAAAGQAVDPAKIEQMITERVQAATQPLHAAEMARRQEALGRTVDAFFSDPKNKYAKDVGPVMLELIKSGQTRDLSMAYEMAILRTPEVKAKYLADLAGSGSGGQGAANAAGDLNVNSSGQGAPAGKPKTMDDTMNAIVRKHFGTK